MARGQRLREILKQAQNSPIPVEEQTAIIYTGINGYLDDIDVNKVPDFIIELREDLKNSKPDFGKSIRTTKKLDSRSEELLKKAIEDVKQGFAKA